jgi:hypothetical protein
MHEVSLHLKGWHTYNSKPCVALICATYYIVIETWDCYGWRVGIQFLPTENIFSLLHSFRWQIVAELAEAVHYKKEGRGFNFW